MKHRVVRGIAVWLLSAVSWSICTFGITIYVNGMLFEPDAPILVESESILVPIVEFGRSIGIETTVDGDRLVLRWNSRWRRLTEDQYALRAGVPYAMLNWMVGIIGGEAHRVGESWYVETVASILTDVEATSARIVFRFDGFTPIVMESSKDETELLLTIYNCVLGLQPQLIMLGEEKIASVRIPSDAPGCVSVRITLQNGTTLRTETYESSDFYSFVLEVAAVPDRKTTIQLEEGLVLRQMTAGSSTTTTRIDWLYVDAWRDRYRLTPVRSTGTHEGLASIEELADSVGAVAATSLGCPRTLSPVDLLIVDGIPHVLEGEVHSGLGFDLFGWWTYFSSHAAIYARHSGERIALDDVNRPLLYGEVVAYPPGYVGTIARGVAGSFLVVKVRSDRVVSVYEGPFVMGDPTATLLVASGDAKARLSLIRLGDALTLECSIGPDDEMFTHAFTAGPILVDSGVPAVGSGHSSQDPATSWTVLATDWHGGLILLTFTGERESEEEVFAELMAFLDAMPVPIRDAIVLTQCGANSLLVRDPSSIYQLGSRDLHALALCLVPLTP